MGETGEGVAEFSWELDVVMLYNTYLCAPVVIFSGFGLNITEE